MQDSGVQNHGRVACTCMSGRLLSPSTPTQPHPSTNSQYAEETGKEGQGKEEITEESEKEESNTGRGSEEGAWGNAPEGYLEKDVRMNASTNVVGGWSSTCVFGKQHPCNEQRPKYTQLCTRASHVC